MEEKNEDGICVERFERIYIPIHKKLNCALSITVARGDSGKWYFGRDIRTGQWGSGYAAWPKFSDQYPSRGDAIVAAVANIRKVLLKNQGSPGEAKKTKLLMGILDEFVSAIPVQDPPPNVFSPQGNLAFCSGLQMLCIPREKKKTARGPTSKDCQLSLFSDPEPTPANPVNSLMEKGFSRDEAKILLAGFDLLRYDKEVKTVWVAESQITWDSNEKGWAVDPEKEEPRWYKTGKSPYKTFAEAERAVKTIIDDAATIEVNKLGIVDNGAGRKLLKESEGFEFYRSEGIIPGHGTPRIKNMGTNWGNWKKFETGEECQKAWDELMLTDKALQG
jgi:hypothetical protein